MSGKCGCSVVSITLYDREMVTSITQADLDLPPTAFSIRSTNDKNGTYHYGIVNQTTGLVKAVGTTTGTADDAETAANAALTTWLAANGYTEDVEYTVFIVGKFKAQSFKQLSVGDAYSTLSSYWGQPEEACFKVITVAAGVITSTIACGEAAPAPVFTITQADTAAPPTAFVLDTGNCDPSVYMWGIVNQTTGLVKAVSTTTAAAAAAQTTANASLTTMLGANGFAAATQYTVFMVGTCGAISPTALTVGAAYSGLAAGWGTPVTKCTRVETVTAGVIATTAVCV